MNNPTKQTIRRDMKIHRSRLSEETRLKAELAVLNSLEQDLRFIKCRNIVAYWSMPDELPTQKIIETLGTSHNIFLPVIVGQTLSLRLYEGTKRLIKEPRFGVMQPISSVELLPDAARQTAILVPGIAFAPNGQRIGHGNGYYDRMLVQYLTAYKIGIAFVGQHYHRLPVEPHDVPMDRVIFA